MTDSIRRYQAMKDAIKAGPPPKEPTVEDVFPDEEMVPYEEFAQEVVESKEWPKWEPYRVRTLEEWMEIAKEVMSNPPPQPDLGGES